MRTQILTNEQKNTFLDGQVSMMIESREYLKTRHAEWDSQTKSYIHDGVRPNKKRGRPRKNPAPDLG